jgi:hypothetical protein
MIIDKLRHTLDRWREVAVKGHGEEDVLQRSTGRGGRPRAGVGGSLGEWGL